MYEHLLTIGRNGDLVHAECKCGESDTFGTSSEAYIWYNRHMQWIPEEEEPDRLVVTDVRGFVIEGLSDLSNTLLDINVTLNRLVELLEKECAYGEDKP